MLESRLEDLPNEVLRQVLAEFAPKDTLKSWSNINIRFNRLILSLDYHVRFIRGNVVEEDVQASLTLRSRVVSLVVTKRWCQLIPYFSSIRALRIVGWAYPFKFSQIEPRTLPLLKYVEYWCDVSWNSFMEANDYHYAQQIVQCHARKLIDMPTISCQVLRRIELELCTSEALASILRLAPNLVDLDIGLYRDISIELAGMHFVGISTTSHSDEYPSFSPTPSHYFENVTHEQLRRMKIQFDCETTLTWLDAFLLCTPHVTRFSLCIQRSYEVLSFASLHRIVSQRLPNVSSEHFQFRYCCLPKPFNLEQHRNIGPLFETMVTETEGYQNLTLLIISVNWKSDDPTEYDDDDDYAD